MRKKRGALFLISLSVFLSLFFLALAQAAPAAADGAPEARRSPWRVWDCATLAALSFYYGTTWALYGRSAKRAPLVPGTQPPENLSPGLLRYLRDFRIDERVLGSEILNLAVGGWVHLDDFTADEKLRGRAQQKTKLSYSSLERMMGRKYRLRLTEGGASSPNPVENIVLHNLFHQSGATEIVLDSSGTGRLKAARRALTRHFSKIGERYAFRDTRRWGLGLMLFEAYTAFAMFEVLSRGVGGVEPDSEHALAFMAPLFFLAPLFGGEKIWKNSTPLFILRTVIPFFFCVCGLILLRGQGADPVSLSALAGSVAVIGFFGKLAPSRSEEGVRLLDKIDSFQLGLGSRAELKEEDTVQKFERLLPYAYALELERPLIARYDPLIAGLRHYARWHTADTHNFSGGAEYYSLTYELGEAISPMLRGNP